jgi:metal-responsive CopG/Arc/MetJ family transcriptional regulator
MWTTIWRNTNIGVGALKTIQMTIDEPLLDAVDRVVERLRTTRSAFVRQALEAALARDRLAEMEGRHERGYEMHPPREEEFDAWVAEQLWGEE